MCAGMIIAMSMMQVYAGDVEQLNGTSVEQADYSNTCIVDENISEGIAKGVDREEVLVIRR